jgi:hypothetical protein
MSETPHCVNHPKVETYLRCNKCNQPICVKCAVQTPVGYRCRNCINTQQQVFYADFNPVHYLVAAMVALPLSLIAGWLIPSLGWYAIILGPLAGGGIAEAARWAIGRRRGPYIWLVVCGCIVVGWLLRLPSLLLTTTPILPHGTTIEQIKSYTTEQMYLSVLLGWLHMLLWQIVYLVAAVGAAYARLRPGRRV